MRNTLSKKEAIESNEIPKNKVRLRNLITRVKDLKRDSLSYSIHENWKEIQIRITTWKNSISIYKKWPNDKLPSKIIYKLGRNNVKVISYPKIVAPAKDLFFTDFSKLWNQNNEVKNTTIIDFSNATEFLNKIENRISHSETIQNEKFQKRKKELLDLTEIESNKDSQEADEFIEENFA